MAATPDGIPVPDDGRLPDWAGQDGSTRQLSIYLHVPFCASRCGYCDFNTYTPSELAAPAAQSDWLGAALAEVELAGRVLAQVGAHRQISTVFVGGGTPSLVGAVPLARLLDRIRAVFSLAPDAEITTEANPESTDQGFLEGIRAAGFTRLSLGMQSASPAVLATLDRRHTPGRVGEVVRWAQAAGFEHINLDLIYGSPAEREAEFARSLATALDTGADHLSAYSLIVEPGTLMYRKIAAGQLAETSDDVLADRYLMADEILSANSFAWYEVSNWARSPAGRCRHNLAYWRGDNWWGIGPGAHSHIGGVRWWNIKHPARYAAALAAGRSPGQARELLDDHARRTERVLLELRLADGLDVNLLSAAGRCEATAAVDEGLLVPEALATGRAVLTLRGRLLADGLAMRLLG